MPTYQYACTNAECGNQFELVQSFTDPAATECPVCGQRVRKVYGSVGVVFKGSGFYRNDSRDAAGRSGESKPATSDTGSKSESSSSSDAKPSTPAKSDSGSTPTSSTPTTAPAKAASTT